MRWRNPFTDERVHPIDLMVLAVACLLAAIGSLKGALGLATGYIVFDVICAAERRRERGG